MTNEEIDEQIRYLNEELILISPLDFGERTTNKTGYVAGRNNPAEKFKEVKRHSFTE